MLYIVAAFIFFTQLPLARFINVPQLYFKPVIGYWSLTGWLTTLVASGSLFLIAKILPVQIAIILAITIRLLLTGAFHEGSLYTFLNAFGEGGSRDQILATLKKDPASGPYGVIGLILYLLLLCTALNSLPLPLACVALLVADPWSKFSTSIIANRLPYALPEMDSKIKTGYNPLTLKMYIIALIAGIIPSLIFLPSIYCLALIFPLLTAWALIYYIRKRIKGYTEDCLGAIYLISELSFFIMIIIIHKYYMPLYSIFRNMITA